MATKKPAASEATEAVHAGTVRIPSAVTARLARMVDLMSARAGVKLPHATVVRGVLERGLDALEAEFEKAKR